MEIEGRVRFGGAKIKRTHGSGKTSLEGVAFKKSHVKKKIGMVEWRVSIDAGHGTEKRAGKMRVDGAHSDLFYSRCVIGTPRFRKDKSSYLADGRPSLRVYRGGSLTSPELPFRGLADEFRGKSTESLFLALASSGDACSC